MKAIHLLFVVVTTFLITCSSPKKTPAKPAVKNTEVKREGSSFSTAIVIRVEKESEGLREEYKWLSAYYPGHGLIRRSHVKKSSRHYDIVTIKTKQGEVQDIYFDSTSFSGKN